MKPILVREIQTLKHWSEQARARNCKPLDFNSYRPLIRKTEFGWKCSGMHPSGYTAYGFGQTPEEAYSDWTYDHIPF